MLDEEVQVMLTKDYEIRHWMRELNCSEFVLFAAVRQVGHDVNAVRQWIAESGAKNSRIDNLRRGLSR